MTPSRPSAAAPRPAPGSGRRDRRRVGVFGGTFDPPHVGHIAVAREVVEAAQLDRLLWVPAAVPPHKADRPITRGGLRRRLVAAAIEDDPKSELCDLELKREGMSYTVDTLREIRARHPGWSLSLVMGTDLFADFPRWKEPQAIMELAELVVIRRPGADPPGEAVRQGVRTVRVTPVDVSSSLVRDRVGRNLAVTDMVTPAVLAIIEEEGLYGAPTATPERGPAETIREK